MSFSRIGAYADGVVFKEYYQEELNHNPLYRHMLYALQHRDQWPEEAWLEAVRDFRDYEYSCFKNALYRMHEIDGQEAVDYIRENEFIFFQSTFPLN